MALRPSYANVTATARGRGAAGAYPPGTPCWVELASPAPDASARFYGELLGWEAAAGGDTFTLEGDEVAGLARGERAAWATYVAATDRAAIRNRVEAAGGSTLTDTTFTDAEGAAFAVTTRGAERVNGPGALTMNELRTGSLDAAAGFYGDVFGWTVKPIEQDGAIVYAGVQLDGRLVAGMLPMPDVPAHWAPYFGVEGLDAAAAKAGELGGRVVAGPVPVPQGRFVALLDPHGAAFALLEGNYDPPPGG